MTNAQVPHVAKLIATKGDTYTLSGLVHIESNGVKQPFDFTGATVTFEITKNGTQVWIATRNDFTNDGRVSFTIPATETAEIDCKNKFTVRVQQANGTVRTLWHGEFQIYDPA